MTNQELERLSLLELQRAYKYICFERKLELRPLTLELFDSTARWGQFDPQRRLLSISKKLVFEYPWQHVLGVLKHEMAHQIVHELFASDDEETMHGPLFKKACELLGVPPQYTKSGVDLQEHKIDWRDEKVDSTEDRLLDKIKKLLALADSGNDAEARRAMEKVQELYAKYNLEQKDLIPNYFHLIVSSGKARFNTWEQKVVSILIEHFFVQVIYLQQYSAQDGKHHRAFEIIGTRENVLMAEYVYHFLLNQVETMLKQNKEASSRFQKLSYRLGVLEGFSDQLKLAEWTEKKQGQGYIEKALALFKGDDKLKSHIRHVHPHLTTRSINQGTVHGPTFYRGAAEGMHINLKKPVSSSNGNLGHRLGSKRL